MGTGSAAAALGGDAELTTQQAAAIRAEADIVTANLKNFPVTSPAPRRVVTWRELEINAALFAAGALLLHHHVVLDPCCRLMEGIC